MPATAVIAPHLENAFGGIALTSGGTTNVPLAEQLHDDCQPVEPAQLDGHANGAGDDGGGESGGEGGEGGAAGGGSAGGGAWVPYHGWGAVE